MLGVFLTAALTAAVVAALTASVVCGTRRRMERPHGGAGAVCTVCGEGFESVERARQHAIDTHSAIDAANWRDVIEG